MPEKAEFATVFRDLRSILAPYAPQLRLLRDEPGHYDLETYTIGPNKRPIYFGGVRVGKQYVSYYLMCVYGQDGSTLGQMSPALKKHMQGKACFNFKTVDPALFKELEQLTARGYTAWKKMEWVD